MNKLLNLPKEQLIKQKSLATLEEIIQQPTVWMEAYHLLLNRKKELIQFLNTIDKKARIIFAGAGSSDYVGRVCAPFLSRVTDRQFEVIATTDIVSSPFTYLKKDIPTVLVSFGRSGNSPESVAAYNIVEEIVEDAKHIIITCNKNGELSQVGNENDRAIVINLPAATHDRGFAMTSSYSTMLLTALLVFQAENLESLEKEVYLLSNAAHKLISDESERIFALAKEDTKRMVYLGSGELYGIAKECALKFLELTAGSIVAVDETPLGFRHGPKSLIDNDTTTIVCVSNDSYTQKYDLDIVRELVNQRQGDKVISLGFERENLNENHRFVFSKEAESISNLPAVALLSVVFGQLYAFYSSYTKGITVDNPCPTGEVNRVVKGVTIYLVS